MAVYSAPSPHLSPLHSFNLYSSHLVSQTAPTTGIDTTSVTSRSHPTSPNARPLPSIPEPSPSPAHQTAVSRLQSQRPRDSFLSSPPSSSSLNAEEQNYRPIKRVHHQPFTPSRVLSSFMPRTTHSSLVRTLQDPSILASLLEPLSWTDVHQLLCTCKSFQDFFHDLTLRDVVLSRFVPGYRHCLRHRDLRYYQDVQVSIHDLDLLLISQRADLHRYPMHALHTMTSLYPTFEDDEITSKLVALTQAHSRFVLLLQALAHSSSDPLPLEPEEIKAKARFLPVQTMRELTFPAPLAYSQLSSSASGTDISTQPRHNQRQHIRSRSVGGVNTVGVDLAFNAALQAVKTAEHGPRPSASSLLSMMSNNSQPVSTVRKGRRLSIFGKSSYNITPPPPEEPRTLKIYHNSWRRSTVQTSFVDENGFTSLRRPPERRFGFAHASSDSSISARSSSGRDSLSSPGPSSHMSLHDLRFATLRTRAPVLRVFVPSTDVALEACECELQESGVWDHLSTGDIVCNFGYVPPTPEDGSSDGDDPSPISVDSTQVTISRHSTRSRGSSGGAGAGNIGHASRQKWLLFNGEYLVPYTPPDLLPLDEPLNLPSPFYYAHIMLPGANPTYIISRLPVCDDVPQLTLVHSTTKVPSPHSPKGYALVKRYAWTARVVRLRTGDEGDMGDGWFGEWILEYEGTREGKETLLAALGGRLLGRREWELVREKSGAGKIWLKLLP